MYKGNNHGDNMQLTIVLTFILDFFGRVFFNSSARNRHSIKLLIGR